MVITDLIVSQPIISLGIFSAIVTLVSTLIHKWLTDQNRLKSLKQRQKELQKELKNCKDEKLLTELNAELLQLTMLMLRSSMKPLVITLIPFLLLFAWLRGIYTPVLGNGWIWYYIGFSLITSVIFRKLFRVV